MNEVYLRKCNYIFIKLKKIKSFIKNIEKY